MVLQQQTISELDFDPFFLHVMQISDLTQMYSAWLVTFRTIEQGYFPHKVVGMDNSFVPLSLSHSLMVRTRVDDLADIWR